MGIETPAQKRASSRWSLKQSTRVLALEPRGSQLTTSKRPPPIASTPAGSPAAGRDRCRRGSRVDEQRADPLVWLAGEVADHRQADRAPARIFPIQRHGDSDALEIFTRRITRTPADRGTEIRPQGHLGRHSGYRKRATAQEQRKADRYSVSSNSDKRVNHEVRPLRHSWHSALLA